VEAALSFAADDAVYDRPPPFGLLTGKAVIRGFIETLVAKKARIELLGLRTVAGESVKWKSRVTQLDATDPTLPLVVSLNESSSIVRNGLIVQHTARSAQ